jgi:hypothetical protein
MHINFNRRTNMKDGFLILAIFCVLGIVFGGMYNDYTELKAKTECARNHCDYTYNMGRGECHCSSR